MWADFPHAVMCPDYTICLLPARTTFKKFELNQPEHHRNNESLYLKSIAMEQILKFKEKHM